MYKRSKINIFFRLKRFALNKINIEYANISKENYSKDSKKLKELGFVIITEYHAKKGESLFFRVSMFLKRNVRPGYDCFVLKRDTSINP